MDGNTGRIKQRPKKTNRGVALFSLSPRMDVDNIGVDFDVVRDVIARTLAAKKSWNVEVAAFQPFISYIGERKHAGYANIPAPFVAWRAAPPDEVNASTEKNCGENAYAKGEVHRYASKSGFSRRAYETKQ